MNNSTIFYLTKLYTLTAFKKSNKLTLNFYSIKFNNFFKEFNFFIFLEPLGF